MVELFSEDPVPVDRPQRFSCSFGGDALQAATASANLGTPSGVATVVGDDPFAEALLSWLRRCGVSTDLVVRAAAPEETTIVADEEDAAEAARSLSARGPSVVLVGCGAGGAVVAADGSVERIDAPPVHCIDTTGAGDALTGGFVHGLLNGMPPSAAARVGVAAGSLTVTRRGGGPSIPNGEEVRALVEDMRWPFEQKVPLEGGEHVDQDRSRR